MAKDYAKIKALAASIIECIGDEEEGKSPDLPKQKQDFNDGGQESLDNLSPLDDGDTGGAPVASDEKKKKKEASMAMMTSMLKSKFS